jgi:hypothetical protein
MAIMMQFDHTDASNGPVQPPPEPDCGLASHRRDLFDALLARGRTLAARIGCEEPTFAEFSQQLTDLITSYHDERTGGHNDHTWMTANNSFIVWSFDLVLRSFNDMMSRQWSLGCPSRSILHVATVSSGTLVLFHEKIHDVRIRREHAALVITDAEGSRRLPIIAWRQLRDYIRSRVLRSWKPDQALTRDQRALLDRFLGTTWSGYRAGLSDPWLEKALHRWWKAGLSACPPLAVQLQKRLWSFGHRIPQAWPIDGEWEHFAHRIPECWLEGDHLWREPRVAHDIMAYSAASIAAASIDTLLSHPSAENGLEAMRSWPALFSPDGAAGRSLRRTLMNLPRGIPPAVVVRLKALPLQRPLTRILEFMVTVIASTRWSKETGRPSLMPPSANRRILVNATEGELAAVWHDMRTVGVLPPCSRISIPLVRKMAWYLIAYPKPYSGRVMGLWRRSLAWHRARLAQSPAGRVRPRTRAGMTPQDEAADRHAHGHVWTWLLGAGTDEIPQGVELSNSTRVARPAWTLPAYPGMTFLETVGAIREEGDWMCHCVGLPAYLTLAMAGHCHFFHVEHQGEHATIQLSRDGSIISIKGPRNAQNEACTWARNALILWRQSLPAGHEGAGP